jgi:hypothetical protein
MKDSFMITDVAERPRVCPAVEPTLFDLGDAETLPRARGIQPEKRFAANDR